MKRFYLIPTAAAAALKQKTVITTPPLVQLRKLRLLDVEDRGW